MTDPNTPTPPALTAERRASIVFMAHNAETAWQKGEEYWRTKEFPQAIRDLLDVIDRLTAERDAANQRAEKAEAHAASLDKNWSAVHDAAGNAIRDALGLDRDCSIPECIEKLAAERQAREDAELVAWGLSYQSIEDEDDRCPELEERNAYLCVDSIDEDRGIVWWIVMERDEEFGGSFTGKIRVPGVPDEGNMPDQCCKQWPAARAALKAAKAKENRE